MSIATGGAGVIKCLWELCRWDCCYSWGWYDQMVFGTVSVGV